MNPPHPPSPARPPLFVLILVYAVWLAIIAWVATMPEPHWLGVPAMALVLFVWLPFWAWRNWQRVTSDLPATYATVIVALLFVAFLSLDIVSLPKHIFRPASKPAEFETARFALEMGLFFSAPLIWRGLRSLFTRK